MEALQEVRSEKWAIRHKDRQTDTKTKTDSTTQYQRVRKEKIIVSVLT